MFAIEGPTDIIRAPTGTLWLIQRPASRPPGTPPDPARKVVDAEGWIFDQLGMASVSAIRVARAGAMIRPSFASRTSDAKSNRVRKRAASTATAGAIGSRYWNPLTGNSWKKPIGTPI